MKRVLLVDENKGIYVPKQFATEFANNIIPLDNKDYPSILKNLVIVKAGPDHQEYWEAWDEIFRSIIIDMDDVKFTLEQDGDLWGIPIDGVELFSYEVYDDDGSRCESGQMWEKDEDHVRARLQSQLGDNADIRNVNPV